MCVAKLGQQAKRMDVKTFKRRCRGEEIMFESKKGTRALPADPLPERLFFRIIFRTFFFLDLIGFWIPFGLHSEGFSMLFASISRA